MSRGKKKKPSVWKIYRITYLYENQDTPVIVKVFAINRGSAEIFILEDLHPRATSIKFVRAEVASTKNAFVFRLLKNTYNEGYDNSRIREFYMIEPALAW